MCILTLTLTPGTSEVELRSQLHDALNSTHKHQQPHFPEASPARAHKARRRKHSQLDEYKHLCADRKRILIESEMACESLVASLKGSPWHHHHTKQRSSKGYHIPDFADLFNSLDSMDALRLNNKAGIITGKTYTHTIQKDILKTLTTLPSTEQEAAQ